MNYYVCPLCGSRWFDHGASPCQDCGCKWPYPFESAAEALELAESIQSVRRRLGHDDRRTVGELAAGYNRLHDEMAELRDEFLTLRREIAGFGLHSVKA